MFFLFNTSSKPMFCGAMLPVSPGIRFTLSMVPPLINYIWCQRSSASSRSRCRLHSATENLSNMKRSQSINKLADFVENPYRYNHPMTHFLETSARDPVDSSMTPRQDKLTQGYIRANLYPFYHDEPVSSLVMSTLHIDGL